MWTGFLRRRLPARLRRRRGWRPGLHRIRYRVPQANHRRQKGGRRSAAADPIDEIELLRCSPHADEATHIHFYFSQYVCAVFAPRTQESIMKRSIATAI